MITAIASIPLAVGANRVVRGVRVPHVVGNPFLDREKDWELSVRIVRAAMSALSTRVQDPTLFEP